MAASYFASSVVLCCVVAVPSTQQHNYMAVVDNVFLRLLQAQFKSVLSNCRLENDQLQLGGREVPAR